MTDSRSRMHAGSNMQSAALGNSPGAAYCLVKSRPDSYEQMVGAEAGSSLSPPRTVVMLPHLRRFSSVPVIEELRRILADEAVPLDAQTQSVWTLQLDPLTVMNTLSRLGFRASHFDVNSADGVHTWTLTGAEKPSAIDVDAQTVREKQRKFVVGSEDVSNGAVWTGKPNNISRRTNLVLVKREQIVEPSSKNSVVVKRNSNSVKRFREDQSSATEAFPDSQKTRLVSEAGVVGFDSASPDDGSASKTEIDDGDVGIYKRCDRTDNLMDSNDAGESDVDMSGLQTYSADEDYDTVKRHQTSSSRLSLDDSSTNVERNKHQYRSYSSNPPSEMHAQHNRSKTVAVGGTWKFVPKVSKATSLSSNQSHHFAAIRKQRMNNSGNQRAARTTILPEQYDYLFDQFKLNKYPPNVNDIAKRASLPERVVTVWYQNARALERKGAMSVAHQGINKRCPVCRVRFSARSALEQHYAGKHLDKVGGGQLNVDALPESDSEGPNEESIDSFKAVEWGKPKNLRADESVFV